MTDAGSTVEVLNARLGPVNDSLLLIIKLLTEILVEVKKDKKK